jgi:CYTH domain-containing protein
MLALRLVIDTNVLISAALKPESPQRTVFLLSITKPTRPICLNYYPRGICSVGATRSDYEYEIPLADATEMLDRLCQRPLIEKTRYCVSNEGLVWEIDELEGDNRGLIVAEVELKDETQSITLPGWVDQEVTGDPRYFNANLVANPFSQWE